MQLETLNLELSEALDAANEAFDNGSIDENSIPYKVLKEILKLRPKWRGIATEGGEAIRLYGPNAWHPVPELSNTPGAILHLDGTLFLPAAR